MAKLEVLVGDRGELGEFLVERALEASAAVSATSASRLPERAAGRLFRVHG